MRRAMLAVGVVVAVVVTAASANQRVGEPPFVAANPWDPPTLYSGPSLCDMHEDLRDRMQPVLRTIAVETAGTRFDVAAVQAAHARATALLLEWKSLEYWMADARAQEPDFGCYRWGFTQPEDDSDETR